MTFVTIEKAAELIGKSTQTVYRHVRVGKLSRSSDGSFDVSELIRVYGELKSVDTTNGIKNENKDISMLHVERQYDNDFFKNEINLLRNEIKELKTEFREREKRYDERENRLLAMLEHKKEKPEEQKSSSIFSSFFTRL